MWRSEIHSREEKYDRRSEIRQYRRFVHKHKSLIRATPSNSLQDRTPVGPAHTRCNLDFLSVANRGIEKDCLLGGLLLGRVGETWEPWRRQARLGKVQHTASCTLLQLRLWLWPVYPLPSMCAVLPWSQGSQNNDSHICMLQTLDSLFAMPFRSNTTEVKLNFMEVCWGNVMLTSTSRSVSVTQTFTIVDRGGGAGGGG